MSIEEWLISTKFLDSSILTLRNFPTLLIGGFVRVLVLPVGTFMGHSSDVGRTIC